MHRSIYSFESSFIHKKEKVFSVFVLFNILTLDYHHCEGFLGVCECEYVWEI